VAGFFVSEVPIMPVPGSLASLSTTPGSNPPGGGENPFPELDDHLRQSYAFHAQHRDAIATKLNASAVSAYMLTVLDDANAGAARVTLGAVGNTGNETIAGIKTFSAAPVSSAAASAPNELMRKGEVDSAVASAMPAGAVQAFAMSTPPTGWLKANGQLVSRTTYAALFAAIGTTYGAGDGSTTFAIPDLRGEFIRGWDDERGVDAERAFGSSQADELKSHRHGHRFTYKGSTDNSMWHPFSTSQLATGNDNPTEAANGTAILPTGGNETRPRNVALMYCIKF
jgi:microcystin-dependent protein